MGYFSSGTEGDLYEARHCANCAHQGKDGTGCAVMLAHVVHSYPECGKKSAAEEILTLLIPRTKGGGNGRCKMFIDTRRVRPVPRPTDEPTLPGLAPEEKS